MLKQAWIIDYFYSISSPVFGEFSISSNTGILTAPRLESSLSLLQFNLVERDTLIPGAGASRRSVCMWMTIFVPLLDPVLVESGFRG